MRCLLVIVHWPQDISTLIAAYFFPILTGPPCSLDEKKKVHSPLFFQSVQFFKPGYGDLNFCAKIFRLSKMYRMFGIRRNRHRSYASILVSSSYRALALFRKERAWQLSGKIFLNKLIGKIFLSLKRAAGTRLIFSEHLVRHFEPLCHNLNLRYLTVGDTFLGKKL